MENEKAGCPTDPPKPKINETNRPSFSYFQLNLEDVFTSDGRKFVTFFVDNQEFPHFISFQRSEYEEWLREYFDLYDYQLENGLCSCDITTPTNFTKIEDVSFTAIIISEGGTKEEIEEKIPLYSLFNPVADLKVGLHKEHDNNLN